MSDYGFTPCTKHKTKGYKRRCKECAEAQRVEYNRVRSALEACAHRVAPDADDLVRVYTVACDFINIPIRSLRAKDMDRLRSAVNDVKERK